MAEHDRKRDINKVPKMANCEKALAVSAMRRTINNTIVEICECKSIIELCKMRCKVNDMLDEVTRCQAEQEREADEAERKANETTL